VGGGTIIQIVATTGCDSWDVWLAVSTGLVTLILQTDACVGT
jgi:hypothetical protein